MIEQIQFASPEYVYLLAVPALILLVYFSYLFWRRKVMRFFSNRVLAREMTLQSSWRRHLKFILIFVSLILMAVALMRPLFGMKEVTLRNIGIDIAIVLDMSNSMKVQDIVPDRLTGAVIELGKLLDMLKGGRVALVPFAGLAFIQSPLTSDFDVIKGYLRELRVTEMPVQGTVIARGLHVALKALGLGEGGEKVKKITGSLNKAVLLVTDGENTEGEAWEIVEEYVKHNVKIYTVGVGTPAGQTVPLLDENGKIIGTMKESDGKTPHISRLNETLLKEVADRTGGKYFHYSGPHIADDIYAELEKLEKKEFLARTAKYGEDRFQYILLPAFVLLLLEILLGERKRKRSIRFNPFKKSSYALCVLLLLMSNCNPFITTDSTVDKGNRLYGEGKYEEAKGEYEKAKEKLPESPILHNNLALAKGMLNMFDEAAEDMEKAIEAGENDLATQVKVLFNGGTLLALHAINLSKDTTKKKEAAEQWKKAVSYLEKAIILDPQNPETRHNLEIAVMNGYPPCSKKDDEFEPNNYEKDAKFVEIDPNSLHFKKDMMLCPGDEDWFKIPLNAGEHIALSIKGRSEEGDEKEQQEEKRTPVKAELLADDAKTVVATDLGKPLKIDRDMTYFIRFYSGEEEAPYTMELQVIPECPKGDDGFEENDSIESAKQIQDGDTAGRICAGDEDYFSYTLKGGEKRRVVLQFSQADGAPLLMDLFSGEQSLDIVKQTENSAVATLPESQEDRTYLFRIYSNSGENFYLLKVSKEDEEEDKEKQDQEKQEEEEKKEQQEENREKEREQEKEKEKEEKSQPISDLLNQIDRNPENLEAQEALRAFPFKDYVPEKEW